MFGLIHPNTFVILKKNTYSSQSAVLWLGFLKAFYNIQFLVSEKCKFYAISQSNKLQTTGHNERYITTIYNINEYIFYEYLPKGHEI